MESNELRRIYLQFFKEKNHAIIPSASIMPDDDPTVLFTTAGMHPLQVYLMGQPHPAGNRLANCQKCLRTGDIDDVGDATHLTFFEMLGNWSLGDYFKKEAITMSWEFLTDTRWLGLDPEKISVTVFEGDEEVPRDEESANYWREVGIPDDRIHYLDRSENWWGPAGETGPCGPDTEMFYDTGKNPCSETCRPGCNCGKFFEIWNDVFMSYNKKADGTYEKLKQHNVDTGMGIERTVAVLNGMQSVFEIDSNAPLVEKVMKLARIKEPMNEEQQRAIRIIVDHIKAATFILADDKHLPPSNLGQGYVLRRLIRRTIRQGNLLNIKQQFLPELAYFVINFYKETYPELERNKEFIIENFTQEEDKFSKALRRGLRKFNKILKEKETITAEDAFLLFTSFGFPLEITTELATEQGITINLEVFKEEFEHHRDLSRKATAGTFQSGLADHSERTTRLHTATHLLQQALREILGDHIEQKGSNITPERTRFDFNHPKNLSMEELKKIEDIVNQKIKEALPVYKEIMTPQEAKEQGALGFFEDRYEGKVSVYSVDSFSKEICTGPHVTNTQEIGNFRIQKQKNIGTGLMRIRATVD
ncbi:MAG: alanine--tRNA ligase [Candidatus Heimdallarchaeota archaeon]|nr:MAG: alanine--tRNA ligase [Candidatus Heimdallarchaeota archaeon]